MADITNIINVALLAGGAQAGRDNMNIVAVMTPEQGVLSTKERYRTYKTAAAVAADFGTSSSVTEYANTFFATSPNAVNFGGSLVVGYYRAAGELVPETSAYIIGNQLPEALTIQKLQAIDDGSFTVTVGDDVVDINGLDFQTCTSLEDVESKIKSKISTTGLTVTLTNGRFVFDSETVGELSTLTYLTQSDEGTFIGGIIGVNEGSGAVLVQGAASESLSVETKLEGITALKAQVNIKGACFIEKLLDDELMNLSVWAKANAVLLYAVFSGSSYLTVSNTNPVWQIKLSGGSNFRMLYSKSGNRKLAVSYMARVHTVNFNAENSALTMHLKELSVPAEGYNQTELDNANRVGLDIYTTVKNTPVVLTSPANDFVDNVYNITAFIDSVQTDMFNLLKSTSTKLAQTTDDVNKLIDQGEKTTQGFVNAGVFAPGVWSSPDTFGNVEVFNRNIEQSGYYWLAGSLADQPQSEREQRKSPVLQAAVKSAGALHSADIIINFNK